MGSDSNIVLITVEVIVVSATISTIIAAITIIAWIVVVCVKVKRMARLFLDEKITLKHVHTT